MDMRGLDFLLFSFLFCSLCLCLLLCGGGKPPVVWAEVGNGSVEPHCGQQKTGALKVEVSGV